MEIAAILAIGGLVLSAQSSEITDNKQREYLAIAEKVAGSGKPDCTAYLPDGRVTACTPRFSVRQSGQVNAWSHGGHIQFSSAALQRLSNDQFALLAGHEIAHYYLGHSHSSIANELEADALGALLACRAGFDLERADDLFRYARSSRSHPTRMQRHKVLTGLASHSECSPQPEEQGLTIARSKSL